MTYKEVRATFFNEECELVFATREQIDRLCEEVGNDRPLMHYDMCKEELDCLRAELF